MSHSEMFVEQVLEGLKDFQRQSVDYVFRRLYLDDNPVRRFLIADEVGLGKTLVARGIIAKAVDHLRREGVERIDVIYICSNQNIARQNINRLSIPGAEDFSLASRITLLPITLDRLAESDLNFVSFTPGTSFNLRSSTGRKEERALLYYLLRKEWGLGKKAGPINLLQCGAKKELWGGFLKNFRKKKINRQLRQAFLQALRQKIQQSRLAGEKDIRTRFEETAEGFGRRWKHPLKDDCKKRNELIGELRHILAVSCIKELEPDLIILDEFQRFRYLLQRGETTSELAYELFEYQDSRVVDHEAKVILLSATPYKMYTTYYETGQDDHYKDFLETVQFLLGPERTLSFRELLRSYRLELYRLGDSTRDLHYLGRIRDQIESTLREVMVRTERLAMTADRNGMIIESGPDQGGLRAEDLAAFRTVDRLAQTLGVGDHIEYWKSSPYLPNLMDEYVLKRQLKAARQSAQLSGPVSKSIQEGTHTLLNQQAIQEYREIDPANAKMRILMQQGLEPNAWKLLWIPPALPYYQLQGSFAEQGNRDLTKRLVFSSWKIVPKAIAMLCSYEAERRIVGDYAHREQVQYGDLTRRRRPLLRFGIQEDRPLGMSVFTLLYPCLTLALQVDPMVVGRHLAITGDLPSANDIYSIVHEQIERLLEQLTVEKSPGEGPVDQRWYWVAPVLLDRHFHKDLISRWFEERKRPLAWETMVHRRSEEQDTNFSRHVGELCQVFQNRAQFELGPYPADLAEILTKIALASPAVTTLRAFLRQIPDDQRDTLWQALPAAAQVAMGFRTLFNLPETITLLRGSSDSEDAEQEESGATKPYWEQVLDYAIDGNLQAMMDEYTHILWESLGVKHKTPEEALKTLADEIQDAISLRTSSLSFDEIQIRGEKIYLKDYRIRCRYALPFGRGQSYDDNSVTREGQVRTAFNSPFRPFILATTSIGQEGLDFHQYCHAIYHWNLPSNPVDLEQREGRIHRYKGHVIRKNLAEHYGLSALNTDVSPLDDPWAYLFDQAKEDRQEENDLIPYWVYEEGPFRIERHLPTLPLSRELERLEYLKDALVTYRMVFGQPRQEDLLHFLQSRLLDENRIQEILTYRIDLTP